MADAADLEKEIRLGPLIMTKRVLRDSHGLTAREAKIVADEILVLMEENFDAGIEQLKKLSCLSISFASSSASRQL